jgi:hypothetical protein
MSSKFLIHLSKSLLLSLALVGSGIAIYMPVAQAINVSVNNFRGTWNAAANYHAGDVVGYQNQSYIAQQANHARTPAPTSAIWYLLAAKGPQGPQGLPGAPGKDGVNGTNGINGTNGTNGINGTFPAGTAPGDMQYWNGTAWVMIPAGLHNTTLKNCNGVPTWVVAHCGGFVLGDTGPAGGIVFYLTDATGQHGLEAAPVDQANATWGCFATFLGITGTAVGAGAANTAAIVAGCAEPGSAAKVADVYSLNGYADWFLPSKDELNLIYTNIGQGAPAPFTNVGGFANDFYWSSTENGGLAWIQDFFNGDQSGGLKSSTLRVRAVRAF